MMSPFEPLTYDTDPDLPRRNKACVWMKTICSLLACTCGNILVVMLGVTLPDLALQTDISMRHASVYVTCAFTGLLAGCVLTGALFHRYPAELQVAMVTLLMAVVTAAVPWCTSAVLLACVVLTATALSAVGLVGCSSVALRLWGTKADTMIHACYLSMAVSGVFVPPLAEPFITPLLRLEESALVHNTTHTVTLRLAKHELCTQWEMRHQLHNTTQKRGGKQEDVMNNGVFLDLVSPNSGIQIAFNDTGSTTVEAGSSVTLREQVEAIKTHDQTLEWRTAANPNVDQNKTKFSSSTNSRRPVTVVADVARGGVFYPYTIISCYYAVVGLLTLIAYAGDRNLSDLAPQQAYKLQEKPQCRGLLTALLVLLNIVLGGVELCLLTLLYVFAHTVLCWSAPEAAYLVLALNAALIAGRALGIPVSRWLDNDRLLIGISISVEYVSLFVLAVFSPLSPALVWLCVTVAGVSLSTQMAGIVSFGISCTKETSWTAGLLLGGRSLGGMLNPYLCGQLILYFADINWTMCTCGAIIYTVVLIIVDKRK